MSKAGKRMTQPRAVCDSNVPFSGGDERSWLPAGIARLLLLILLLLACTGGATDEARKSWRATLQFTAAQWLENRVPSSFVRTTCESAGKILPREAQQLEQAVARNDRAAVARLAESLKK